LVLNSSSSFARSTELLTEEGLATGRARGDIDAVWNHDHARGVHAVRLELGKLAFRNRHVPGRARHDAASDEGVVGVLEPGWLAHDAERAGGAHDIGLSQ
jgi:hypothetical protein